MDAQIMSNAEKSIKNTTGVDGLTQRAKYQNQKQMIKLKHSGSLVESKPNKHKRGYSNELPPLHDRFSTIDNNQT